MFDWLKRFRSTKRAEQPRPVTQTDDPPTLSIEHQWTSISRVASGRLDAITASRKLQSEASRQIDAAYYALGQIVDELATVMQLPEQQRTAAILPLDPSLRRIIQPSKAPKQSEAA